MDATETSHVISFCGGDSKFAELLGINQDGGYQQRVNNWKRRGLPSDVMLAHYETIQRLRQEAAQAGPVQQRSA